MDIYKASDAAGHELLATLYSRCLELGCAPAAWRKGCIVSIHKRGDRSVCDNYRGITLLPPIGKLFMSLVKERVLTASPPHCRQYAFVRGRGCTDASFNLLATIETQRNF